MGSRNTYITEMANQLESPLTFTPSVNSSSTTRANIDRFIELLSAEGSDPDVPRLFLDKMDPSARASCVAVLLALKGVTTDT